MTNDRKTLIVNGRTIELDFRPYGKSLKTRLFVEGTTADMEEPEYSTHGKDPENDKRWAEFRKDEIRSMKRVIKDVREVLDRYAPVGQKLGITFSMNAGCSMCSCSPGFVASLPLHDEGRRIGTIYLKA